MYTCVRVVHKCILVCEHVRMFVRSLCVCVFLCIPYYVYLNGNMC